MISYLEQNSAGTKNVYYPEMYRKYHLDSIRKMIQKELFNICIIDALIIRKTDNFINKFTDLYC